MVRETPLERQKRIAHSTGVTSQIPLFNDMCKRSPERIGIIAEGDSWFAYPRKWIAVGADMNIVHHIADRIENTGQVNLLRLASNGDEAVEMTSGPQFRTLAKILQKNADQLKLLLFSAGGNDIVGKDDMYPLLRDYTPNASVEECINLPRLEDKLEAIILAYKRLVVLCEDSAPQLKIIAHTYDIAKPWDKGAEFFWGRIKTRPWIYPYLVQRRIPDELHLPVIEYMLTRFAERLMALAADPAFGQRLTVVNTQGTLRPGSNEDWENEIHPSKEGFEEVAKKIYQQMQVFEPDLPGW